MPLQLRLRLLPVVFLLLLHCPALPAQRNFTGSAEIRHSMEKLLVTGSVLMIAAHPDDENTAVIAYFARGRKMHTGYLSLNRGEGGQNLLGPEQGALIGLIRTQELLEARKIDGGVQYFTRVLDFGFSKSADETLAKWGREKVLRDVVWVIRKFRPDIIINRFSGTPRDGHGHHQSSAMLSKEAFHAAADAARFPEQLRWVQPWQAKRLFWNTFNWGGNDDGADSSQKRLTLPTGEFNPLLGYSYQEIAGMSRSLHRSQTMGSPERKGEVRDYLVQLDGEPAEHDPFEGIDITWDRVSGAAEVKRLLEETIRDFDFGDPSKSLPGLLRARQAMAALEPSPLVERKLREIDDVIVRCAGLWLEASTVSHEVVPGGTLKLNLEMVNRSGAPLIVEDVSIHGVQGVTAKLGEPVELAENKRVLHPFEIAIPASYPISQPYWLKEPAQNDSYQIAPEDEQLVGLPETPPSFEARFVLAVGEGGLRQRISVSRPVHHRYVDPMYGELVRPLVVTPAVTLELGRQSILFPSEAPRKVEVTIQGHQPKVQGEVVLEAPAGWKISPKNIPFEIAEAEDRTTVEFEITPPRGATVAELRAVARMGGQDYDRGMVTVSYPHFPPQTLFPRQTARLVREPLSLLSRRIGYVMGAGDEIPQALEQMGAQVTLLTPNDLSRGDLSVYDAIVTGVRAQNTRPDLLANRQRLLDYVRGGGTLVAQYFTIPYFSDPTEGSQVVLGPYPFRIGRGRVSVEDAPVKLLRPEHPLLNVPNRIEMKDFDGWVQERGLYFPAQFDEGYETVIASHDPNEEFLSSGILFSRSGKGAFVFTSYSWFRQLPAGVPGAFKIFANLVSAGKVPAQ
jgi:LmbE family N-acetylglucosaminyl deacetylase